MPTTIKFKTTNAPTTCQICGKQIWAKELIITSIEDKFIYACPQCYNYIGQCTTCEYQPKCGFKNDYSEPQMVRKTVRQGGMVIQTQGKNPNLMTKHCTNCRCAQTNTSLNSDIPCLRDDNNGLNCPNYKIASTLLQS